MRVLAFTARTTTRRPAEEVEATERLLPEVAKNAFVAAQQIDMNRKRKRGLAIAGSSAAMAAAASAIPIPGAAMPAVLSINAGMVVGIAAAMGVSMDRSALMALGASIAGGLAMSTGGRMLLGEAIKFIPGVGSVVGGGLEATVAGATTYGLGAGFTEFLLWFHGKNARMPEGTELRDGFKRFWDQRKDKQVTPPK